MSNTTTIDIKNLKASLKKNKKVDFRTADLLNPSDIDTYKWTGLEEYKESLSKQLTAYQRLWRIVPHDRENLAQDLLKSAIQSSLQIANTPRQVFIQENLKTSKPLLLSRSPKRKFPKITSPLMTLPKIS